MKCQLITDSCQGKKRGFAQPHLGAALACIAILIDAHYAGSLIDNRKYPGGYLKMIPGCEAHVERLRALHADKNPIHYTIADGPPEAF